MGQTAIAFNDYVVNVYDQNGNYINGYYFYTSYVSYYVAWEHEELVIIPVRSKNMIKINLNGELVAVQGIAESKENCDFKNNLMSATERTTAYGYSVEMHNRGLGSLAIFSWGQRYSVVVATDLQGNMNTICDV